MRRELLKPNPFFKFELDDYNGRDRPLYDLYPDCDEPQAAFIQFNMFQDDWLFFLAGTCTDFSVLARPSWRCHLIRIPISPLVSYADLENLCYDEVFFNLTKDFYHNFIWASTDYSDGYTDKAKQLYLEMEEHLKKIKVPEVENHREFFTHLKSISKPVVCTGITRQPPSDLNLYDSW